MAEEKEKETTTPPVAEPIAEKVPETPPVVPPEAPAPTNEPDDLRELVKTLAEKVDGMAETIAQLAPNPMDSTPTNVPWTHRGSVR